MLADDVLPQLLARRAADDPDKIFACTPNGDALTRKQLHDAALAWAGALREIGVGEDDSVLVMTPTSLEALSAWIGIGWLRAIEVPTNTQYRGEILAYIINDSRARVLLIDAAHLDQVAEIIDECPLAEQVVVLGNAPVGMTHIGRYPVRTSADLLAATHPAVLEELTAPAPHHLAAIVYTSGTTGPSKGVMMPWGQLYTMAHWCPVYTEVGADDRLYAPFPFYHITVKSPVYAMMQCGGSILLEDKFSSKGYWDKVVEYNCTLGILLGGMCRVLMLAPPAPTDATNPMRFIVTVPAIPETRDFEHRFGLRLGTIFGMTEVSTPLLTSGERGIENHESCGRPRPGCELRIVDAWDNVVPVGQVGELIMRTDEPWTLNRGYWNKPEATAEAWRNGWFHTGDAFRVDEDGNYYYVDRFKDAIRRRGENISSVEVENLVNQHPSVEVCAAIGVAAEHGEEEVKIVVVLADGHTPKPRELIDYLEPRMPHFMLPRYVEFVDSMPMTPTQKVRKVELRAAGINQGTWDREAAS